MQIEEIYCKTALSPSKLPGLDYSLNPYSGCQHQCIYCYVPSVLHIPRTTWNSTLKVKRNIPLVLAKELQKKKPGVVGLSTVTDPYQPIEEKYQLSSYCLEQLLRKDFPICIQTKSSLVLKDFEIITQFSKIEVMMSIATDNESQRKLLESGSSSLSERIKVLKTFGETTVKTSVFLGPLYPTVSIDSLPKLLDIFVDARVDEIMIDTFHVKPGLQQQLTTCLQNEPELLSNFSTEKLLDKKSFTSIQSFIHDYLKRTGITVVDAF